MTCIYINLKKYPQSDPSASEGLTTYVAILCVIPKRSFGESFFFKKNLTAAKTHMLNILGGKMRLFPFESLLVPLRVPRASHTETPLEPDVKIQFWTIKSPDSEVCT